MGTFATMRAAKDAERTAVTRSRATRVETCDSFAERWVGDFPRAAPATRRTYTYPVRRFADDFRGMAIGNLDRRVARALGEGHAAVERPRRPRDVQRRDQRGATSWPQPVREHAP